MTDMSQIPAHGLNHYTMLYGLNSNKLKDKVVGHWSAYWNTMEDCFSDIITFSADMKEPRVNPEWISMHQKQLWSMMSNP